MPTNSNYDEYFSGIGGAPIFTYGMITITSLVLAYMTYMDPYIPEVVDIEDATGPVEPILEATSMDGVAESFENALPEEPGPSEQPQEQEEQPPEQQDQSTEQQDQPQEQQDQSTEQEQPQEQQDQSTEQEQQDQSSEQTGGKRKKRTTRRSRPSGKKH